MVPGTLLLGTMFNALLKLLARPFGGVTRMVERKITAVLLNHASLQSETVETFIHKHVKRCLSVPHVSESEAIKMVTRKIVEDCGVSDDDIRESVIEYYTDDISINDDDVREACIESTMENMYIDEDSITQEITEHFADDINIDADDIKTEVTDGLRETLQPQLDAFVAEVKDGYLTSPEMTSKLLDAIAAKFSDQIVAGYGQASEAATIINRIIEDVSKAIQLDMIDAFAAGRRAKAIAMSYDASADAANEAANAASKAAAGAKSALQG